MATYDKEIDYNQSATYFKLKERHIYGSSRVGVRSSDVDLLALQSQKFSMQSVHYSIGSRTYELSNHLGNVLSVISDTAAGSHAVNVIPYFEGGGIAEMRADIRVAQDYSPFGVTLSGRDFTVDERYRYGYQGSEKDDEVKGDGNSYTTYFRQLDPRLGRWLSIDPKTGSIPWQSPYCSMDNNPVSFNDILGDSIKNEMTGVGSNQALKKFLETKSGYNEISKYAAAGQTIEGYYFEKNGIFHDKGIDLKFTDNDNGIDDQGTTRHSILDSRLKLVVNINSNMTTHQTSRDLKVSNDAEQYKNNPEEHKKVWNKFIAQKGIVITHEMFVHVNIHTQDALDGKMDYNIAGKTGMSHHNYIGCAIANRMRIRENGKIVLTKSTSSHISDLYVGSGWYIAQKIHKDLNTGLSDSDIFRDFSHGTHCLENLDH